jgi:hypothetical protein
MVRTSAPAAQQRECNCRPRCHFCALVLTCIPSSLDATHACHMHARTHARAARWVWCGGGFTCRASTHPPSPSPDRQAGLEEAFIAQAEAHLLAYLRERLDTVAVTVPAGTTTATDGSGGGGGAGADEETKQFTLASVQMRCVSVSGERPPAWRTAGGPQRRRSSGEL